MIYLFERKTEINVVKGYVQKEFKRRSGISGNFSYSLLSFVVRSLQYDLRMVVNGSQHHQ